MIIVYNVLRSENDALEKQAFFLDKFSNTR